MIVWIALNLFAVTLRWDPYPFILLNLAFSTQAAYAAPLILLAQNRQENRDRVSLEEDRRRAEQTKADTEYLARELAALRLAVGEVATRDYLRRELEELRELLERAAAGRSRRRGKARQEPTTGDVDQKARFVTKVQPLLYHCGRRQVCMVTWFTGARRTSRTVECT